MSPQPNHENMKKIAELVDHYLVGRLFEWTMSIAMIGLSFEIFIWPQTLKTSAFHFILLVMSGQFIGLFMMIVGVGRSFGLILNGHQINGHRIGPLIRSGFSIISAFMWVQFALALVQQSIAQGIPSPGCPFWFMFTFAELFVVYRAVVNNGRVL
jgi:hypothetical protein